MLTYTRAGTIAAIEKAQARGATITYTPRRADNDLLHDSLSPQ